MGKILCSSSEEKLRDEMYKRIKEELAAIRAGIIPAKRLILVVPAQETLQTEEDAFKVLGGNGFFDLHVMSGAKLRDNIMSELGYPRQTVINTIGRRMLLRKIAVSHKKDFSVFNNLCTTDGFLDLAGDFIVQIRQNEIDPASISTLAPKGSIAHDKLSDMEIICREYTEYMKNAYTDSEDLLAYCTGIAADSDYIKESIIWFFDFYSFTKRERAFLAVLKEQAADFNLAILSDSERYACGRKTAEALSSLLSMEKEIIKDDRKIYAGKRIIRCNNSDTQCVSIAVDIQKHIREEGLHYSDFAVLSQNSESLQRMKRNFALYDIPVFFDDKRSIKHSSVAIVIENLLAICAEGYKRRYVLGLIKSGVFGFDQNGIYEFENYVKQYKIFDDAFLKPFKYGISNYDASSFKMIESIRDFFASKLSGFVSSFNSADSVKDKTLVLYSFLVNDLKLPDFISSCASELEENLYEDAAQSEKQIWTYIVNLFDQIVELLGAEALSSEEFANVVSASFDDIKIGVLPQNADSVLLGSITRSSFRGIKYLYIADMNMGVVPSEVSCGGVLNEYELAKIEENGYTLAKSNLCLAEEELFQIERALDTNCNCITLLYCAGNDAGDALLESPLLSDIKRISGITEEKDASFSDDSEAYTQSRAVAFLKLSKYIRSFYYGDDIPELWKLGYNILKNDKRSNVMRAGILYTNDQQPLAADTFEGLYGTEPKTSASGLENFARCPFRYFINRGLRAHDQKAVEMDSANMGTVYHDVLLRLSERLSEKCHTDGVDISSPDSEWMTVSEDDIGRYVDEIFTENQKKMFDGLMLADEQSLYQSEKMRTICKHFAVQMVSQLRCGYVSDICCEAEFGVGKSIPEIRLSTDFGNVIIEGKIDRLDTLHVDDKVYTKVIDYKSGSRNFDPSKIKSGLELQLMIYLEGALLADPSAKPAGVFYYLISDSVQKLDFCDFADEKLEISPKGVLLDGIVVKDPSALSFLDGSIELDGTDFSSSVFDTKKGKAIISEEEMQKFREDFTSTLNSLCARFRRGCIDIMPKSFRGENVGCAYCEYASICLKDL